MVEAKVRRDTLRYLTARARSVIVDKVGSVSAMDEGRALRLVDPDQESFELGEEE